MLCHSDMLDFVPDTGMETLPMYEEIFDLGEELTFEDLRAAEMSQPKNATQPHKLRYVQSFTKMLYYRL